MQSRIHNSLPFIIRLESLGAYHVSTFVGILKLVNWSRMYVIVTDFAHGWSQSSPRYTEPSVPDSHGVEEGIVKPPTCLSPSKRWTRGKLNVTQIFVFIQSIFGR